MSEVVEKAGNLEKVQPKWYIFRVQSGREEKMITSLKNSFIMLKKDGLDGRYYFTDFNIPKQQVVKYVDGKKTKKDIVAYPGYLFIKIRMTDEINVFLKKFFKMNGFGRELPKPISDSEYQKMIDSVSGLSKQAENFVFAIGQRIKIKVGSFAGMEGTISSIDESGKKLSIAIVIFGREAKTEVNFDQVELLETK